MYAIKFTENIDRLPEDCGRWSESGYSRSPGVVV